MKKYNEYSLEKSSPQININTDTHSKNEDDIEFDGKVGDIEIYFYWNDPLHVPHFHFVNTKTGEKGAFKLYEAEYCPHEIYNATLTKAQLRELYEWLNTHEFIDSPRVQFDYLCATWGITNKKYIGNYKKPDKVPEYYKL